MRNITAAALSKIQTSLGTEPINFIGVEWVDGTQIYYADKELDFARGKIIDLGSLDEILKIGFGSSTSQVSVKLDDTDGEIYDLMKIYNIHKRPCYIYQTFEGLTFDEAFLLFKGEIVTPITWDEGERTISFDILSKIESEEVGFSPEEGQFEFVSDSLIGRVWPLCFGKVVHVPATKSTEIVSGTTTSAIGLPDQSLSYKANIIASRLLNLIATFGYYNGRINDAENIARTPEEIHEDYVQTILAEDPIKQEVADLSEDFEDLKKQIEELSEARLNASDDQKEEIDEDLDPLIEQRDEDHATIRDKIIELKQYQTFKEILEIELSNAEYEFQVIGDIREKIKNLFSVYFTTLTDYLEVLRLVAEQSTIPQGSVVVLNGHKFPQNQTIQIEISNVVLEGYFDWDVFYVQEYVPKYSNIYLAPRENNDAESFWIQDSNLELTDHYLLLTSGLVVKVTKQIGNRCYIELEENRSTDRSNAGDEPVPARTRLLTSTINSLQEANEYTTQEKERIYESAVDETANGEKINDLRERIDEIQQLYADAVKAGINRDDLRGWRQALFKNITQYNKLVSDIRLPVTVEEKAERKISEDEEEFLLRAENLVYQEYLRTFDSMIAVPEASTQFIATGHLVDRGIQGASQVMLPNWLDDYIVENSPPSTLWLAQPGSNVVLHSDQSEKYVANIIPSTVHAVYAYRGVEGVRKLVPVPEDYYTVNEAESIGDMVATTITLKKPLTYYIKEDWIEGIYVTLTSSVGPNTADIIEWIILNYTNLTVDTNSLKSMQAKLLNYPSHFALFRKQDALKLVEDIAWQARCVVFVKNGVLFFKYLSETPTPVTVITESQIEVESLTVEYTTTEDLVTKLTAEWFVNYADDDPNKTIVRHNIARYGNIEETRDFFIYNIQSLVEKSATFWTIRKANTWKIVTFKTFLTNLTLETWDSVTLNIPTAGVSNLPVLATIEKADYDSADNSITLRCWLPIRAGEMSEYDYAYPSDLSIETEFPTPEDVAAGNAGNPRGIPIGQGGGSGSGGGGPNGERIDFRPKDFGRQFMSDAYDTSPPDPTSGYTKVNYKQFIADVHKMGADTNVTDPDDQIKYKSPSHTKKRKKSISKSGIHSGYVLEAISDNYYDVVIDNQFIAKAFYDGSPPLQFNTRVQINYDHTTDRFVVRPPIVNYEYLTLVTVQDNYLACKNHDGETINVAKPLLLRKDPYHGNTYNGITYNYTSNVERTATNGIIQETHVIVPEYVAGDAIHVTKVHGGVGIIINGVPLKYIDTNVDARAWALKDG